MRLIATATDSSCDGEDGSFGAGDGASCVSGAEATGRPATTSLPGSSLLAPDTLWLALTGTSRAGLAQPIHEGARARKPNPA